MEEDEFYAFAAVHADEGRLKRILQSEDRNWQAEIYSRDSGYSVYLFNIDEYGAVELTSHSIAGEYSEAMQLALEGVHRLGDT